MQNFLGPDGRLILARWGLFPDLEMRLTEPRVPMYGTAARAVPLVSNGFLGLDLVQLPAGECFEPHTHPGDHLLIVVKGKGTITYGGVIYVTEPGQVYMVEGSQPHAVGAIEDHAILAVGAPHRPADSADRMALTEYAAVAAEMGRLFCFACKRDVTVGDATCPHAPKPRVRQKPLLLAPGWDEWERVRVADWMGLYPGDLQRAVELRAVRGFEMGTDLEDPQGIAGRLVVTYGKVAAANLYGAIPGQADYFIRDEPDLSPPALIVSVRWAAAPDLQKVILQLAHSLAAAGPLNGTWSGADAVAFGQAVTRRLTG